MPSYYNKPSVFGNSQVEDIAKFNALPFWLVMNEVEQFPTWNEFDQLFGKINWETNQGPTMKAVTPQRSPVGRSFFFPNSVSTVAKKDIYTVTESVEQADVRVHKYESFQFNFLPSFQVFWDTYLQFANNDIVRQIACSNNQFIETNMWFTAPYVWLAGSGLTGNNPTSMGNEAGNAAGSKTAAWLTATVTTGGLNQAGVTRGLTLRDCYGAMIALQNDLAAPSFQGVQNMPKDNEGLKGKYVLMLSSEAWLNFTFDPDVLNKSPGLAPYDLNLVFNDFKGSLFGLLTCKIKKYPVRFSGVDIVGNDNVTLWAAGMPIDPEIFDPTDNKWKPNPYWTNINSAPFEVEWILGADYCKTIRVGPPPKEFATTNMSAQKFYSMKWNGEVQLTDQVLITDGAGNIDLNIYGEQLKYKSKLTHGYLPGERRYAFPMIIRRQRPPLNV